MFNVSSLPYKLTRYYKTRCILQETGEKRLRKGDLFLELRGKDLPPPLICFRIVVGKRIRITQQFFI